MFMKEENEKKVNKVTYEINNKKYNHKISKLRN